MNKKGALLAGKILSELEELTVVIGRIEQGMQSAETKGDDLYLDSVALNLHGFYSGVERIFERIAAAIDGAVPEEANWHQELLKQMSIEVPGVRPAVISSELKEKLEEYRGFRHVVRNVYTYQLNPKKLKPLVRSLRKAMKELQRELVAFVKFIQTAG